MFLYSADLNAAFDLLRPDYLINVLDRIGISRDISRVIGNFLSDRTGYVSFNGCKNIPIGCVQGSVLGPRLFNIYMSDIESSLPPEVFYTSYADDSYVGVSCDVSDFEKTIPKLEKIMDSHFKQLEDRGMVVNRSKTEIVVFNRWGDLRVDFPNLGLSSEPRMKILGIDFKYDLN